MMHRDFIQLLTSACEEGIALNPRSFIPSDLCRLAPLSPVNDIQEPFAFGIDPLEKPPLPTCEIPREKLFGDNETKALLAVVVKGDLLLDDDPLLKDPEFDRDRFARGGQDIEEPLVRAELTNMFVLSETEIPPAIPLDDSKDDGLLWSLATFAELSRYQRTLETEKLGSDPGIIQLLQSWVKKPNVDEDLFSQPQRISPLEPVSPPLLPLPSATPPPILDFTHGLEAFPELTGSQFLADFESEILKSDAVTYTTPSSSIFHVSSPITSPIRTLPTVEDRKVEVPLTPPGSNTKCVSLSSIVATEYGLLPVKKEEPEDDDAGVPDFKDIVKKEVQEFVREAEQEQLQQADSTMRVPVPALDFTISKHGEVDIVAMRVWAQRSRNKWTGLKSLEIGLRWAPFSRVITETPVEILEGDDDLETYILSEKDIQDPEKVLIASLETVSIQNDDEEVEVLLEPLQFDNPVKSHLSIKELIRRKKRRKEEATPVRAGAKKLKAVDSAPHKSERFSAINSLNSFMHLRTGKGIPNLPASKNKSETLLPPKPSRLSLLKPPQPLPARDGISRRIVPPTMFLSGNPTTSHSSPAPILKDLTKEGIFIISTTLLTTAPFLVRRIRTIYPSAKLYERDFSTPTLSAEPIFLREPPPVLPEADIILSPTTGLIYTTLDALRQRPLPGQPILYGHGEDIKASIISLVPRYERLIVITKLPLGGAQGSDIAVLSSFIGFAAALARHCTIIVRPVEGATTAEWVVAAMLDERDSWNAPKGLLEEETTWERFLRKLGLNAFAAQEVVRRLVKMGGEGEDGEGNGGGVLRLLRMPDEEIVERFGEVVGPRVVERLVQALNRRWGSTEDLNNFDGFLVDI